MYWSSSRHVLPRLSRSISRGHRGTRTALPGPVVDDDDDAFQWFPRFFNQVEQHALLSAALRKLDAAEPRASRKRRRDFLASSRHHLPTTRTRTQDERTHCAALLEDSFLPDYLYHFEEGHYDGVIRRFREMRVSTWNGEKDPILKSALGRLERLYPNADATQTHLLHLASNGEILPHVDNIGASGSWILGVSLGSERILRMEPIEDDVDGIPRCPFDVSLPSGSVYIQKDSVRYNYKHSILATNSTVGKGMSHGQRVSIMIRDCLPPTAMQGEAPPHPTR